MRHAVLKFTFLAVFFVAIFAHAATNPQTVESCVKDYGKFGCHLTGYCNTNVLEILKMVRDSAADSDLKDMRVLYLKGRDGDNIAGYATKRAMGPEPWGFHVVLEHEGEIIDPDFYPARARIPAREYFDKMFPPESSENIGLEVQSIPATDYLNEYGGRDPHGATVNYDYYRKSDRANERYPTRPLHRQDPMSTLALSPTPQDLAAKRNGLLVEGNNIRMRVGGTLMQLRPGQRGVAFLQGKYDQALAQKFLAVIDEAATKEPAVRGIVEDYHAKYPGDGFFNKVLGKKVESPSVPPPKEGSFVVSKHSGHFELDIVEEKLGGTGVEVTFRNVKLAEEDFIAGIRDFARSHPEIKEFRLNLAEVYGMTDYVRARSQGFSKVDAVKQSALYRALGALGLRAENLDEASISDYEPILRMRRTN